MADQNGKTTSIYDDACTFTPMNVELSKEISNGNNGHASPSFFGKVKKRKNTETISIDLDEDGPSYENGHQNDYADDKDEHPSLPLILITIMASACFYSFFLGPVIHKITTSSFSRIASTDGREDFQLAISESYGFFDDVPNHDWLLMKERIKQRKNHFNMGNPTKFMDTPAAWYQNNFEPDFSCAHERRVGGMGDGPKWVCDPHRIHGYSKAREESGGNGCLVYSVGSQGNFEFEIGLQQTVYAHSNSQDNGGQKQKCEIHIFDPEDYSGEAPEGIFYHAWGLESSGKTDKESNFKSFQETVAALGHQGRVIDVFKIDCEGCEWRIYQDLFNSGVTLMQILVEVHMAPDPQAINFFETMQRAGYATFHKEPNIIFGGGVCQEYALVKLNPSFST